MTGNHREGTPRNEPEAPPSAGGPEPWSGFPPARTDAIPPVETTLPRVPTLSQFQPPPDQPAPPLAGPPPVAPSPAPMPPTPYAPPPPMPASPPPTPRPEDLLAPDRPATTEQPARYGWRGRLHRASGGLIKPRASAAELGDRQAALDIRRTFSRPMTIVVIQPKGGAGKTPTTVGLASALGSHRGGYVVGWDDNETRGTLSVRVANLDSQRTTAWDLLGALDAFERTDARVGDLGHYVRAQAEAQFDALVSDDNPANMAQIGEEEFRRIHAVLQRFYRLIVIDTGNNVRSPNWQAAVNAADIVVVVSTYQRDVGYSGSWVLDHLTQTGRDDLARRAVTVLTSADPQIDGSVRGELLQHFGARTQAVVEIPYDPAIAVGGPIRWNELADATRSAWVRAGAVVVSALAAGEYTEHRPG